MLTGWLRFGLSDYQEELYRKSALSADIAQAKIGIWLIVLPLITFACNDYWFLGLSWLFALLVSSRAGLIFYTLLQLKFLKRVKNYYSYDRALLLWSIIFVLFTLAANATRPQNFIAHVIIIIISLFIALLIIPNRFSNQIIISLTLTFGEVLIMVLAYPAYDKKSFVTVLLGMLIATAIGISASWQLHYSRRREFLARGKEQEARTAAERELHNRKYIEGELRNSARKYEELLKYAPTGIFEADFRKRRLIAVNDALCRLLGYTREELLKINPFDLLDKRSQLVFQKRIEQWLKGEKPDENVEYRVKTRDGHEICAVLNTTFTADKNGEPLGATVIAHDITERKRVEKELRNARNELEKRVQERTAQLERRTGQLRSLVLELTQTESRERKRLATILHDHLQQLLVGAKLGLQLVQKQAGAKADLQESFGNVDNLLNESIRISRSLTIELSPPVLHEGGLIPAIKWLAGWMEEKYGLSVDLSANAEIPPDKQGFCTLLFDSIRELLFNVVKHAGTKKAMVSIDIIDGIIRAVVEDNGSGFDVTLAEKDESGSRFGLFSIRERITFLDGKLDIESTPGTGTRVTLLTPLPSRPSGKPEGPDIAPAVLPATAPVTTVPDTGGKIHVLIADDHKIVREGLTRLIQSEPDMDVAGEAANGDEALDKARDLHPDVIIMDMSMPGTNGLDATRKISIEMPKIRVIGLSMYEEEDWADSMLKAGAAAYLTKDGPSEDLLAAIRALRPVQVHNNL